MSDDRDEDRDATNEDCAEPTDDAAQEAPGGFTRDDELQEGFVPNSLGMVIADDGLPAPVVDDVLLDAHAPPYLPEENQCCAEIAHTFVRRDRDGRIVLRWAPESVTRTEAGHYVAKPVDAEDAPMRQALIGDGAGEIAIPVRPIRPKCEHLLLQLRPPSASIAHVMKQGELDRYCTLRRSVAGAFLCLTHESMKACSERKPFDLETAKHITHFEATLAEKSRNRVNHPMFVDKTSEGLAAFKAASAAVLAGKPPEPEEAKS